jgi:hypothetical protein
MCIILRTYVLKGRLFHRSTQAFEGPIFAEEGALFGSVRLFVAVEKVGIAAKCNPDPARFGRRKRLRRGIKIAELFLGQASMQEIDPDASSSF